MIIKLLWLYTHLLWMELKQFHGTYFQNKLWLLLIVVCFNFNTLCIVKQHSAFWTIMQVNEKINKQSSEINSPFFNCYIRTRSALIAYFRTQIFVSRLLKLLTKMTAKVTEGWIVGYGFGNEVLKNYLYEIYTNMH